MKITLTLTPEEAKVVYNTCDGQADAGACKGGNTPVEGDALVSVMNKLDKHRAKWRDADISE